MFKIIKFTLLFAIIILAHKTYINQDLQKSDTQAIRAITDNAYTAPIAPPLKSFIENDNFTAQTFNNCGPATLSMLLSYYDIHETQEALGSRLRPYQNPNGDNDDKSVTLQELSEISKDYGLIPYHRPNGDIPLLKKFITAGIPVLTKTWISLTTDIGHYRIVKGYNDQSKIIINDDPYQGPGLEYTYDQFEYIWSKHNYEYLILATKEQEKIVKSILAGNLDEQSAWYEVLIRNEKKIKDDPSDIYSRLNISVAAYHLKDYQRSISEFEKIEWQIPIRTLWYQIEPIQAYHALGKYDKVFTLTDSILNNGNRAFAELYLIRSKIYQKQKNLELAQAELEKAKSYNPAKLYHPEFANFY